MTLYRVCGVAEHVYRGYQPLQTGSTFLFLVIQFGSLGWYWLGQGIEKDSPRWMPSKQRYLLQVLDLRGSAWHASAWNLRGT